VPKVWLIEALAQKWEGNKLAVEPTGTGSQPNLFSTLHFDQGRKVKPKRYVVETQAINSTAWEAIHTTDSLSVAKRYAAAKAKLPEIQVARVVNQITGQVMANEQG
jgi:hypothetical protein